MGVVTDDARRRAAKDLRRMGASEPRKVDGIGAMALAGRIGEAAGVRYAPYEWTPDEVCSALADLIDPGSGSRECSGRDAERRVRHLEYLLDGAERKAERRRRHILMCEASNSKLKEQIRREHDELNRLALKLVDARRALGDLVVSTGQLGIVGEAILEIIGGGR